MPAPLRPGSKVKFVGKSPAELALELVRTPRFAFFTDTRGVVYCEQVDHSKVVMACLGKTMGGQPTLYRNVLQWQGDESKFNSDGRELIERGFTIERDMAYMLPNMWGAVKVIRETTDLASGKKMRKLLREGSPEGALDGNTEVPNLIGDLQHRRPIQPFTAYVLNRIGGSYMPRSFFVDRYRGAVPIEDVEYLDKWVANG